MSINITLGDSELEIMKILWKATNPITSVEIGEAVSYRSWKKTTISTFLTRLTEKGAISAKKQGHDLHAVRCSLVSPPMLEYLYYKVFLDGFPFFFQEILKKF